MLVVVFVAMPVRYLFFHVLWCQASWGLSMLVFPFSSSLGSHDISSQAEQVGGRRGRDTEWWWWNAGAVKVGGQREVTELWDLAFLGYDEGELSGLVSGWLRFVPLLSRYNFFIFFFSARTSAEKCNKSSHTAPQLV